MIDNIIHVRYDTLIPTLYHQRKEHLLPIEFRQSIPHSTASTWRNQTFMNFKGSEFIHMQREGLEWYELFLETASKRGKATIPPDTQIHASFRTERSGDTESPRSGQTDG